MHLTKELFVIPEEDDNFYLYAPLNGTAMKVNEDAIALLKKIKDGSDLDSRLIPQSFFDNGIIEKEEQKIHVQTLDEIPEPTEVILIPTTDCNLKCVYCINSAGETKIDLEPKVAFSTIDFIVENALRKDESLIKVDFHGGGEPFLLRNWDNIRKIVDYAKDTSYKNNLELQLSSITNGILNNEQLNFIVNNFGNIFVSMDGPQDIQDSQRPPNSFKSVMKTIDFFDSQNYEYSIGSTITRNSVKRMKELVIFFHEMTSVKNLQFEPVFECGRCKTTGTEAPETKTFIKYFFPAYERAKKLGIVLSTSPGELEALKYTYCGATGKNFIVTPEGFVTSCLEVTLKSDPRSDIFFYGYFEPHSKKFKFELKKFKYLTSRTVNNLEYCSDCFVKYNCAGGCLTKVNQVTGDIFNPSGYQFCDMAKNILLYKIKERLR